MDRFALVATLSICGLLLAAARADDADPIRDKLEAAKTKYAGELDKAKTALQEAFQKKEDAARASGQKKLVDQLKVERREFEELGTLPKSVPTNVFIRSQMQAQTALESAYRTAIKEYTRAKRDDDATDAERQLEEFRNGAHSPRVYQFTGASLPERLAVKVVYNDVRTDGIVVLKEMSDPTAGIWSIKNGELLLRSPEDIKNTVVRVPDEFEKVQELRVQGRIVPPTKSSLRITSGNVYLILNWENAGENHVLVDGKRIKSTSPHVLAPNKVHEISAKQAGDDVVFFVDDAELCTVTGRLATPIDIGSSHNGVIGVKKIVVTGTPRK